MNFFDISLSFDSFVRGLVLDSQLIRLRLLAVHSRRVRSFLYWLDNKSALHRKGFV